MNNFSIYSITLILSIFYLPLAQANPGGVSTNLQLWLKAGTGISETDGQAITSWTDQSTNSYTASNGGSDSQTSPTFRDNISDNINYNPTVEFDGVANGVDLASNYIYSSSDGLTFFAIVKPDIKANQINFIFDFGRVGDTGYGFVYANDAFKIYTPISHGGIVSDAVTHSYNTDPIIYTGKINFNNEQRVYLNGTSFYNNTITLTKLTTSEITEDPVHSGEPDQGPVSIGRMSKKLNGSNRLFDGKIAEVILYDADLTDANRNKVQSYLAIKYGITLDSSIDYVDSNDTVIYPSTTTHSSYINDIAGIGTDNGSSLNQPKSISVNSDSIITITGSGIADGNLLIWGNNNGALTFSSIETPSNIRRFPRKWIASETGEVGNIIVSFDLTNVVGADLTDATKYHLLIDANGDFSDANVTTGGTFNGNAIEFSGVNLNHSQYFSLAYTNTTPIAGFGTALDFDGTDDYISANVATTATDNITMEAWIKWTGSIGNKYIFNNGNANSSGYGLKLNNSYKLDMICGGVTIESSNKILPANEWHHVALVRNNGTWEFYFDSIAFALTGNPTPNIPNGIMTIGSTNTGSSNFQGLMDEMRVWNVARTQDEIKANMNLTLNGDETGLVGYWQFEDNTGRTVVDSSPNGNNGILNGDMTWNFSTNQNTPLNGSLADFVNFDADGDPLTYILVDNDGGATVLNDLNTGTFTYTPATSGTHTFTYKVNDGLADSNIAAVTVNVTSLIVDNISDIDGGDYSAGQNTLREAIANSNAGDTITFDSSIAGQTIVLSEQLTIDKDLTIDGTGQKITIGGNDEVRVFEVTTGTVTFKNLTITNGNSVEKGAGIFTNSGTTVTIINSTLSNNSSDNDGDLNVYNSTFYKNHADCGSCNGGGIRSASGIGIITRIKNSTFSHNSAGLRGAAIDMRNTLYLENNILANSTAGEADCNTSAPIHIVTNINNLIENNTCGFGDTVSGFIGNQDPNLGSLQDNGGDTQTMVLLAGSPAINAGDNTTCEATDQRGESRPKHDTCDIGAYEYELPAPINLATNNSETQINLSWTDSSLDETGFKIERDSSLITTITTTNYNDDNLTCETIYNYSVMATNSSVDSVPITTNATTSICPPTNLSAKATSENQINLKWTDNSSSEIGFKVMRGNNLITTTSVNATSYNDIDLNCNGIYTYSVMATSTSDSSSITTQVTTLPCAIDVFYDLTITKNGNGTVTGSNINCGAECVKSFTDQTAVSLVATPNTGWLFSSWTGDCDNVGQVKINSAKTCTANFIEEEVGEHQLTINIIGSGTITDGKKIDCPDNCEASFLDQEIVHLTIKPKVEWILKNWSCDKQVYMDDDKICDALFIKDPNIPNNGDGNDDGIHDADQPNVASMPDQSSGNYLTLDIKGNVILKDIYTDLAENQDYFEDKYIFPQGLVYFELEGTEANITIYYHSLQKLRATPIFQKFGTKVPGDMNTLEWYVLPNVIFDTVQVGEKSVVTATYNLKDGELGDSTGIDGRIIDPGGLSFNR